MADERVDEAVFEVEAVLEDKAASDIGSAAEFDAGAVRWHAFWAFEVVVLMVLEGLRAVPFPLV